MRPAQQGDTLQLLPVPTHPDIGAMPDEVTIFSRVPGGHGGIGVGVGVEVGAGVGGTRQGGLPTQVDEMYTVQVPSARFKAKLSR